MNKTCLIPTHFGVFELQYTERGLYRLIFPKAGDKRIVKKQPAPALVRRAGRLLAAYLRGKPVSFLSLKIDRKDLTPFEKCILSALSRVRYGAVCSYQQLAKRAGYPRAARAAGSVMRKNRLPIILPCHRVIASGGGLGGYSGGLSWKRRLLNLESQL